MENRGVALVSGPTTRWLGAVALAAVACTGCFYPERASRPAHRDAYLVDVLLAGLGVIAVGVAVSACRDHADENGTCYTQHLAIAGGLLVAGGVGALVNRDLRDPAPAGSAASLR